VVLPPAAQAADLHEAVTSGDVEQVRALLAAGADANTRDALGATPLHDAAWTGNREIAALLIAHRRRRECRIIWKPDRRRCDYAA
jgi:ankyrin repeat protein